MLHSAVRLVGEVTPTGNSPSSTKADVWQIDASGVARRSELNSWFYSWQSFSRVRRTRRNWILRAGRTLIVLPVTELSPAEETQLRGYLRAAGLR